MADYIREYLVQCGGINNSLCDELIADNELADARNIIPSKAGAGNLQRRLGYTENVAGVTAKIVRSIYSGRLNRYYTCSDSGTAKDFIIYDLESGGELYSHTDLATTASWVTMDSYDICATGTTAGQLKTSDGATFSPLSGIPAGITFLETYNNFLFGSLGASVGGAGTLYWSAIGDPETWPPLNTLAFNLSAEYEFPTALIASTEVLAFFTNRSMFHIQGFSGIDFTVSFSRRDIGCIGHKAIVATPHGLIWWSPVHGIVISRDWRSIDYCMQRKLQGTLSSIINYQTSGIHCIYRPDLGCVRFFVPSTAGVLFYLRIDYYPATDAFYLQSLDGTSSTGIISSEVYFDYAFGGTTISEYTSSGIKTFREGTNTYENGSILTAYIKTKRMKEMGVTSKKLARDTAITLKATAAEAITYSYYLDNATSATVSYSITPTVGINDLIVGINAEHRKIQHYISDATSGLNEYYSITESGNVEKVQ